MDKPQLPLGERIAQLGEHIGAEAADELRRMQLLNERAKQHAVRYMVGGFAAGAGMACIASAIAVTAGFSSLWVAGAGIVLCAAAALTRHIDA